MAREGRKVPRCNPIESRVLLVPKPNYRHAKKQKEQSRKARQLEKQQRRTARSSGSETATQPPAGPSSPGLSEGT